MAKEYTPSEGDIRGRHADGWLSRGWPETTEIDAEFDRWLAAHDAQVAAKALRDAADDLEQHGALDAPVPTLLRLRADAMTRQADAPAADEGERTGR